MSDEIIREFLLENNEKLKHWDCELLRLEKTPSGRDALASSFRTTHTMNGTCEFRGSMMLKWIVPLGESFLNKPRNKESIRAPQMLGSTQQKGNEAEHRDTELFLTLTWSGKGKKVAEKNALERSSITGKPGRPVPNQCIFPLREISIPPRSGLRTGVTEGEFETPRWKRGATRN